MPDLLGLTLLGLLYGTTVCSLSCLPTLGPLLVGEGGNFKQGLGLGFSFMAGKVVTYSMLGAIAAGVGSRLALDSEALRILPGVALILTAVYLLVSRRKKCDTGCSSPTQLRPRRPLPFAALGAATGITPCAPLAAVMVIAAESGNIFLGAACGLFFGLGLLFSPMILVGGGLSFVTRKIGLEMGSLRVWLPRIAAGILFLNGLQYFF
jgi:cytochrome c-type biogenesis protein